MSATIVPFRSKQVPKKKYTGAESGVVLEPPTPEDLKGFINTLNFLALQSATNTVTIDIMADALDISIRHFNDDTAEDDNEVYSISALEFVAGCPYTPKDQKKMTENLLEMFNKLHIDNHESKEDDTPTT